MSASMVFQTSMVRRARKGMADSRAMEEQMERMNPLEGSGATPSMGLSQFRGGKNDSDSDNEDAKEQGKALKEHLHKLHGSGYARSFHKGMGMDGGLGTGRYEGEGMKGGYLGLAMLALPLISKLLGAGKITQEGHDMMKDMIDKHEQKHHSGKMKGGYLGLAMMALPLISKLLGAGHMSKDAHDKLAKVFNKDEMKGAGTGGVLYPSPKRLPNAPPMELQGKGAPVKRIVGAGDGRRKRAEVVKRVMAEKGLSMIQASKYVKENNLY